MDQEEWLTVQEIADHLRVDESTVRRWIKIGDLRAFNVGGRRGGYRIRRSDFDRFVEDRLGEPTPGQTLALAAT